VRRSIPLTLLGLLIVLAGATSVLAYHQSTSARAGITLVKTCSDQAVVRPAAMVLSCADANSELRGLTWTDWGDTTAYATGTIAWNDCTPDCAAGHWKSQPVTVWAWRIEDGRYTRISSDDATYLPTRTLAPYPG
jgi:hypothetical protein